VGWPAATLDDVIDRMEARRASFDRVCVSMVTHRGAAPDLIAMARRVRARLGDLPISALLTPTLVDRAGLEALRGAGVDRVGIAVDAATPELFAELRGGRGHGGPHRWDRYWEGLAEAAEVFGPFMAGCHLIVGLGETERQMVHAFGRLRSLRCATHLFSFFPEAGSALADRPQPPVGQYRRMQLARYLIDEGLGDAGAMDFDDAGRLRRFGVDDARLAAVIERGEPFRTSGCPGPSGAVACNRPFANSRPGPEIRNFPFPLEPADLARVRTELWS
jgi:biotin synthase